MALSKDVVAGLCRRRVDWFGLGAHACYSIGPRRRVVGVDLTAEMLSKAGEPPSRRAVVQRALGSERRRGL